MTSSPSPRVLLVSAGSPRKSSYVARLAWLKECSPRPIEVTAELGWPFHSTMAERERIFDAILEAKKDADLVILHRVLFERRFRDRFFQDTTPVIFDFDDAIYAVPSNARRSDLATVNGRLKRVWRLVTRGHADYAGRFRPLTAMLQRVDAVSAGNPHLAQFASQYCGRVKIVPTVVDAIQFPLKAHDDHTPITIGWYGSPDNHHYLTVLADVFRRIHREFGAAVRFAVISTENYNCGDVPFTWIPWNPERELTDLLAFDIGIMPLTDDEWARGKSGNKALYYMAAGIPPVVSPVGVNSEIVRNGHNGLWATTLEEWHASLTSLIRSSRLRAEIGLNAVNTIRESHSRESAVAALTGLISQLSYPRHEAPFGATPHIA